VKTKPQKLADLQLKERTASVMQGLEASFRKPG
jgi:hypothetical protein